MGDFPPIRPLIPVHIKAIGKTLFGPAVPTLVNLTTVKNGVIY
jgi:hypothetical protein